MRYAAHRCALVVVPPERTNLVLAPDIPYGERDVLALNRLYVEPNRRDSDDDLAKLELVEDGRLASSIKTDHKQAHLHVSAREKAMAICMGSDKDDSMGKALIIICWGCRWVVVWFTPPSCDRDITDAAWRLKQAEL